VKIIPQERRVINNGAVGRDGYRYVVTVPRSSGKNTVNSCFDFSTHPLRSLVSYFIFDDAEDLTGATVNKRCSHLKLLEEFMFAAGVDDLNSETFISFTRWLPAAKKPDGKARFSASGLSQYVNTIVRFYRRGLDEGHAGWTQTDLDAMTEFAAKVLRGCHKREAQDSVDKALSRDTFTDLLRATALELERCREVKTARDAGELPSLYNLEARPSKVIDPNPFAVFALLGAIKHGIRSSEFNAITSTDLRPDDVNGKHEVYLHAPDKPDGFIPVDDVFVEAWRLCEAWSDEARELAGVQESTPFSDAFFVCLSTRRDRARPLMCVTTTSLNRCHLLNFFKKWFNYRVKDARGCEQPLLHADGDLAKPLKVSYRKLRNAFGVRLAEREQNQALVSQAMRHKKVRTTAKYYLHQTRMDHAKRVSIALTTEAQRLVMSLKNPVTVGISKETLKRAQESGAITPHGVCGSALEGKWCERASDCLV
jgi:hypothetical protein